MNLTWNLREVRKYDMTGIVSLVLGIFFGLSLIYVIFPLLVGKKAEKKPLSERERDAREEKIQKEIERLDEELLLGKILKEDYDLLVEKLKRDLKIEEGGN